MKHHPDTTKYFCGVWMVFGYRTNFIIIFISGQEYFRTHQLDVALNIEDSVKETSMPGTNLVLGQLFYTLM